MLLTNTINITLGESGIYALLGYAMVFFGLILLMIVVILLGKAFMAASNRKSADSEIPAVPIVAAPQPAAPGSAGGVKLYNVEPKIAAMLMAIVAEKTGKPINELRFISIKEVTE